MKIFRAEPIPEFIDEHHWRRSTHKGWVIVRAENEDKARSLVAIEFGFAPERIPGQELPVNPWWSHASFTELAQTEIEDAGYTLDGEEEILNKES
ncbi:hypothetical protein [Nitrospina gracilis]|uniref:hypothetical protein n=1 Tax=Nitrospina gracilis TaxID=35801 RepID=UPI001F420168|nr:hypothetical protein [Nitrospina gracilis]MCF8721882.1 hypothetical protein [Nitrospina gracilis Nb-211]